jgi:hypothetical protein
MGFADSIRNSKKKIESDINQKVLKIASDLFTTVVLKTPVGDSKTKGQLINNWFVGQGKGVYNPGKTSSFNTTGMNSYNQISTLRSSTQFLGKDGSVSLANNVHYAYRAEYWGWNFSASEPRWNGTKPYAMVRNSLTLVAAKYTK